MSRAKRLSNLLGLLFLAAVLVLLVHGCGGDPFPSAEAQEQLTFNISGMS